MTTDNESRLKESDISYNKITEILTAAGREVKLGGLVTEDQIYQSKETTSFIWTYGSENDRLRKLYEKGKESQWNVTTDLDWGIDVDLESEMFKGDPVMEEEPWFKKMTKKEQNSFRLESNVNTLSQFLHGEQGALIATSQLVNAVPMVDSKFYASTQVIDEARHVEVFDKYLREKVKNRYEITQNLFTLLEAITVESRWDFKFLGMQLLVEGLAIAAFMSLYLRCQEPLLKNILRYVMQDEARHVAYGAIALKGYYDEMNEKDRLERQEFIYESVVLMRNRLFSTRFLEKVGLSRDEVGDYFSRSVSAKSFRDQLFVNVVPNIKRIGLLDGFLAEKFTEMGIMKYQDLDSQKIIDSLIAGEEVTTSPAAG